MKILTKLLIPGILFFTLENCFTQDNLPEPWISYPSASISDYGVYHFRKEVSFGSLPGKLIIHVSADNRYILFVNGKRICYGPAKGDLQTYKYDIIDIAPYLEKGSNLIAAIVYNAGKDKPMAIFSVQTAFMLRSEDPAYSNLNTDESWRVFKNPAYSPVSYYEMIHRDKWFYGYYACGPGDRVEAVNYPWNWEREGFDDSEWMSAEVLTFDGNAPWNLVPRNIAFMDSFIEKPAKIRKAVSAGISDQFISGNGPVIIKPDTKASILLDFNFLTTGYPELMLSGGSGAKVKIKYAEALYDGVNLKAHRDSVEGKTMYGVWDEFYPDGNLRTFRPLWKRTFRYVQLDIETSTDPLKIISFQNEFSAYPYPDMSTFECNEDSLNMIFEMGLRTFRLCSGETYYDTPFYEQLSYGGDNRPISSISVYNSTDDRLLREVMRLYPQSVNKETGLFKSAYPSRFDFDMGSWSLAWIQSLSDYYRFRGDEEYIKTFTKDIEGVLGFYHRHMNEKLGILGPIKSQNFMDWSISKGSIPRSDKQKVIDQSTMLTLYYLHTLDCVIDLFSKTGMEEKAEYWKPEAEWIRKSVMENCWDNERKLFTDYPGKKIYSQHSNILAILCNVIPEDQQAELLDRILRDNTLDEYASSYFSFFLFKAMEKTGSEDLFLQNLGFWYKFLRKGHTTCGETGFASHDRSDCHAWAAHPSFYLLNTVCGIKPADTGFHELIINPHPGNLEYIIASVPHPLGKIKVNYTCKKGKIRGTVILPAGLNGYFKYKDQEILLHEGENRIK